MSEVDPSKRKNSDDIEYDAEVDDRILITSEDEADDAPTVEMFKDNQTTPNVAQNVKITK